VIYPGLSPIGSGSSATSSSEGGGALVPGLAPIGSLSLGAADTVAPEPAYPEIAPVDGLLGAGSATGYVKPSVALIASGLLGAGSATAYASPAVVFLATGLLGASSALARSSPPAAADIPSGVTLYRCLLTGAPDGVADAVLPIRSFQVRHRESTASYYQIVIPSIAYIDAIDARPSGQIVIWSDTDGVTEELMRGSLGAVRSDSGPNSQSITISGNASRAATPLATYTITDVLYQYSTFDGEQRLRIRPRAGIRPGDTIRYGELFFTAGVVTWSVSVSASGMSAQMEVATLSDMA
jgi:hypothetical protein